MASLRCYCGGTSSAVAVVFAKKNSCSRTTVIRASMDSFSFPSEESKASSNSVRITSKVNEVYEDKNLGILCYTDCNGELVCEGLDEGPRLTSQDMDRLSKEKKVKADKDDLWRERKLSIAGGIDWSNLKAAVSMGKN